MVEYQKVQVAAALPAGTSVIGSVNEARGKTILYNSTAASNNVQTLRTVTTGKTYYLLAAGISMNAQTNNAGGYVYVSTATSIVLTVTFDVIATYHPSDTKNVSIAFPHPIPIAAGTAIKVEGNSASGYGWIIGWEE